MNILSKSKHHLSRACGSQSMGSTQWSPYTAGSIRCPKCSVGVITTTQVKKQSLERKRFVQHSSESQGLIHKARCLPCSRLRSLDPFQRCLKDARRVSHHFHFFSFFFFLSPGYEMCTHMARGLCGLFSLCS